MCRCANEGRAGNLDVQISKCADVQMKNWREYDLITIKSAYLICSFSNLHFFQFAHLLIRTFAHLLTSPCNCLLPCAHFHVHPIISVLFLHSLAWIP
jgi:hypothetical protein